MAGIDVKDVYVGIAGSHISVLLTLVHRTILNRSGNEVTETDMRLLWNRRSSMSIPADKAEILHVLQGDFSVDEQVGIKNPLGARRRSPRH